jgi:hypothetical protein
MNLFSLTNKPSSINHYEDRKEIEINMALSTPKKAYEYALNVIQGPFKLGENIIATDAVYSYYYAMYVLKGRFKAGEKVISTDEFYSFYYALHVLKGRFEAGEKTILSSDFRANYAFYFLKNAHEFVL